MTLPRVCNLPRGRQVTRPGGSPERSDVKHGVVLTSTDVRLPKHGPRLVASSPAASLGYPKARDQLLSIMAKVDWSKAINLTQAVTNIKTEIPGDWHQDPWGWPELNFLLKKRPSFVYDNCETLGTQALSLLDVPKENWGTRPAIVLDITDRVTYQALTDHLSLDLIGSMSPNAYGWRLPAVSPASGVYSHNNRQWNGYRGYLSTLTGLHTVALKTDLVSFFASIPISAAQEAIQDRCSGRQSRSVSVT